MKRYCPKQTYINIITARIIASDRVVTQNYFSSHCLKSCSNLELPHQVANESQLFIFLLSKRVNIYLLRNYNYILEVYFKMYLKHFIYKIIVSIISVSISKLSFHSALFTRALPIASNFACILRAT